MKLVTSMSAPRPWRSSRRDTTSLSNGSRLPFFFLDNQRLEPHDTLPIIVNLIQEPDKGGVGGIAPSGAVYVNDEFMLLERFFQELLDDNNVDAGKALLLTKRALAGSESIRKEMFFGDPALVIKHDVVTAVTPSPSSPQRFVLYQNYPNPFNPSTTIRYELPKESIVSLKIYNLLGQEVATLVNESKQPGRYQVQWNAQGLSSGVYFYRLQAGEYVETRKLMLLK